MHHLPTPQAFYSTTPYDQFLVRLFDQYPYLLTGLGAILNLNLLDRNLLDRRQVDNQQSPLR